MQAVQMSGEAIMSERPIFREDESSQIPALQLLQNMGWTYLTPEEAMAQRKGNPRNVILEEILEERLKSKDLNRILLSGQEYEFGDANIANAVFEAKKITFEGLQTTSEKVFDLLTLGKSYHVEINGNRKSYDLKYIDWTEESNNVYHVTEEFVVESHTGSGVKKIPDIVLFINGIPIIVIECKRSDYRDPIEEAVSQHIRNQENSNIPNLYVYAQLLLAISPLNLREEKRNSLYATTGTPRVYWFPWIEDERTEYRGKLEKLINTPLSKDKKDRLFADRFRNVRTYFEELEKSSRQLTDQDRMIYGTCRIGRVLEIVKKFILFDGGAKKVARYQQYFAVKQAIEQITNVKPGEKRPNGVVWHTQGSGKSLSMVMLAKALVLDKRIIEPKVVLITDRVDLDDQIFRTFQNCGVQIKQANSGQDLISTLQDSKAVVVATTIHKFDSVVNVKNLKFESNDIILLVDEAHRSQYGESNSKVHKVFPNACFIGYTGTPLTEKERHTMKKFGPIIGCPYTNRDALRDNAVVPLLYEGRMVPQDQNEDIIDRLFERMTKGLTEEQKADLKRKKARADNLSKTDQRIYTIALDISEHFSKNWKGSGFKGLFAVESIAVAMKYQEYFKHIREIETEVIISKTDDRKGHTEVGTEDTALQKYEKNIKDKFGDYRKFERDVKKRFDSNEGPDILIVVWKLLTGFDAQRSTVLYVDKNLEGHTLLQATARVNRTFPNKEFGFIIDYYGNLDNFIKAIKSYDELAEKEKMGYAPEDKAEIESAIHDIEEEIKKLPQNYADMVSIFSSIKNKKDSKEYENVLWEKEDREKFYERLGGFGRSLHLALSSADYYANTDEKVIDNYKNELKFFNKLKFDMKIIFHESIDYRDYEPKIEKILNDHVTAKGVETVIEPVAIYDLNFDEQLTDKEESAQALIILNATNKYIQDNLEKDRAFYEKFSELIDATLKEYRLGRIKEKDLLKKATVIRTNVLTRTGDNLPSKLGSNDAAKAVFGILRKSLKEAKVLLIDDEFADIALGIDEIVESNVVVDWGRNAHVQNKIKNLIEDYLLGVKSLNGVSFDIVDRILEEIIKSAKRYKAK